MHSNPFSNTGYDLSNLQRQIERKADQREIYALRSDVDRLERTVRELSAALDGLRSQCAILQEDADEARRNNGQFGVGA